MMAGVGLKRGLFEKHIPRRTPGVESEVRVAFTSFGIGVLQHAAARSISLEVIRVQLDALDDAAPGEPHDRLVVSRSATTLCFPSVAHVS